MSSKNSTVAESRAAALDTTVQSLDAFESVFDGKNTNTSQKGELTLRMTSMLCGIIDDDDLNTRCTPKQQETRTAFLPQASRNLMNDIGTARESQSAKMIKLFGDVLINDCRP
ncbi:hypothetical protein I203_102369 [Kwoniella mangroviensis CBS 8507]|uniref:uncharacterized protein n=1 Tax=Kwoniella mangroviensis CBS 8507 TaxID=1296122 RepID=UPI00080D2D8F|nr:uncharacterized protein I203_06489 [Kwoniella mangroviensis CBS 8507]OCF64308.1 hypothetical protein I203_06489 [Kwoniella mangroviensis CBS 8507]